MASNPAMSGAGARDVAVWDGDIYRRRDPSAAVLLRASMLLLISGSQGLVHNPTLLQGCGSKLHVATGTDSWPLQGSGLASRKRCRVRTRGPRRRLTSASNVDGGDVTGTGPSGGEPRAAVHTLLIDNYDSYTYNLFQLLAVVNGRAPFVVFNDDDGGDLWRAIERMGRVPDNIVISPGPGRPDVPGDFGMCAQALREAVDIPILGVCLGHEGLGIAHGATVSRAPEPMHGRLSPVFHDDEDALFRGVPQGSRVVRYHSLVVDKDTLSAEGPLKATAWTGDGVLMAMRHEQRPHWGVQFHPESVGTRHGSDIIRNFRDLTVAWCGGGVSGRGGGDGSGANAVGGDADSPEERVRLMGELVRKGYGKPRAARERATMASSVLLREGVADTANDTSPVDAEAKTEVVPYPGRRLHSAQKKNKRRNAFYLLVEEIEMAGGALNGDRQERTTGDRRRRARSTMPDTEYAFRELYGDDHTAWWLDSSSQRPGLAVDGQAKARFTFMGGADGPLSQIIECYGGGRLVIQQGGGIRDGGGGGVGVEEGAKRREVRSNIMDYLKAEMSKMGRANTACDDDIDDELQIRAIATGGISPIFLGEKGEGRTRKDDGRGAVLPFDFLGGFVGFLGYELRHEANDVMKRSAGGTEWDWRPPGGGQWEDAAIWSKAAGYSNSGVPAESVSTETPAEGGEHDARVSAAAAQRQGGGGGDVPLGFLVFADRFVAFDHQEGKAYVLALSHADARMSNADGLGIGVAATADGRSHDRQRTAPTTPNGDHASEEALDWIRRTAASLRGLSSSLGVADDNVAPETNAAACQQAAPPALSTATWGTDKAGAGTACTMDVPRSRYEQSLKEIMRLVGEGETYEVCLTNQIVCERPKGGGAIAITPLDLYSRLRRANPAPYAAYIVHDPRRRLSSAAASGDASDGGDGPAFAVCCSSPEKFLSVDRHGWVESKPIKGTVKRGTTPAEDLILATDLAKGEKNMAENLMIVDLVRNDLGRVCQSGSVSVPKLMHVESYATVHQLVSTIRGQLRPNCGALDAFAAAFPGGSMTGAPKQRTMEIIDRLERGRPRGVYSGSIGFLGIDGTAAFNIVIRTAVVTPQNVTVGAGGAVIALSEVDDEYEEMILKATSVLGALGHEERPGRPGPSGSEPIARSTVPPEAEDASLPLDSKQAVVLNGAPAVGEILSARGAITARNGEGRRPVAVRPSLDITEEQRRVQ